MTIPAALRRLVIARADGRCEYCLIRSGATLFAHEVDHIIARKHGGATTADNLALACYYCNRYKGTDVGSFDPETGKFILLFNPRTQTWDDHFALDREYIVPITPEGRVTVALLQLNHPDHLQERQILIEVRLYP